MLTVKPSGITRQMLGGEPGFYKRRQAARNSCATDGGLKFFGMVAYEKLRTRAKEIALVDCTAGLLNWDEETYMPRKALAFRAEQLAFLSGWSHRQFTAPEVGDWIKACEDHGFAGDSDETVNVREWRRSYDRATKLPPVLVEEFNRATTLARDAWAEARKCSEFAGFQPHLEKLLQLSRQMADLWGYAECRY